MELKENHEKNKDQTLENISSSGFVVRLWNLEDEQGRWQDARRIPTEVFEKDSEESLGGSCDERRGAEKSRHGAIELWSEEEIENDWSRFETRQGEWL